MKKILLALLLVLGLAAPAASQFQTGNEVIWFGCQNTTATGTTFLRTTNDATAACHSADTQGGAQTARLYIPFPGTLSNFTCGLDGVPLPAGTMVLTPRLNTVDTSLSLTLTNSTVGGEGVTYVVDHSNTKFNVERGTSLSFKSVTSGTSGTNRIWCTMLYTYNAPANP